MVYVSVAKKTLNLNIFLVFNLPNSHNLVINNIRLSYHTDDKAITPRTVQ